MRIIQPTEKQIKEWKDWIESKPPIVQDIAHNLDPWTLYLMQDTQQLVTFTEINENGTICIIAWGRADGQVGFMYPRGVFGVNPKELISAPEETQLPSALQREVYGPTTEIC